MATPSLVFVHHYVQYGSEDEGVKSQLVKQLGNLNKGMLWILLANLGSEMEPNEVNDTHKSQMIELIIPRLNAGVGGIVLAGVAQNLPGASSNNSSSNNSEEVVQNLPHGKGKGKGLAVSDSAEDDEQQVPAYVLYLRMPDGEMEDIDTRLTKTVGEIKVCFQLDEMIPVEKQHIFYNGVELDYDTAPWQYWPDLLDLRPNEVLDMVIDADHQQYTDIVGDVVHDVVGDGNGGIPLPEWAAAVYYSLSGPPLA